MAKTPINLNKMESVEVATDDLLIIQDVSKPKTRAITIFEFIKRIFPLRSIRGEQVALNTILPENLDLTGLAKQTSPYSIQIGNVMICGGQSVVNPAGTVITFPKAFAEPPAVTATIRDSNNQTAWVFTVTSSSTTLRHIYTGGNLSVGWMAIGRVA